MSMLVFPKKIVGRTPFIVRLIKGVAHIIATVAANLQGSRSIAIVIYDVNTHHVAIAETVVVDAGHGNLVNVAR